MPTKNPMKSQRDACDLQSAPAGLELDDLPDDLLLEILVRVPTVTSNCPAMEAASLRSVSQRWNSIVSSRDYIPCFISLGEEKNCPWGNGEALLFSYMLENAPFYPFYILPSQCHPSAVLQTVALDFSYISDHHYVICASEDLVLLKDNLSAPLIVCNLFTKRWSALPVLLPFSQNKKFVIVCDPQGHRYRVVSIDTYGNLDCVFVSETGEWENIRWTERKYEYKYRSNILPFNGKLYQYIRGEHIVAYDPFEGSFSNFLAPYQKHRDYDGQYLLGVVHGSLRMLKFYHKFVNNRDIFYGIIIWELDHKQGRWCLIYKSSFRNLLQNFDYTPVALHPYGQVVYFLDDMDLAFLDLSKGCNGFCKVPMEDVPEDLMPTYDNFLLTRPWRPTSVTYGLSK